MVWDGNPIILGCDDHCTTINVINSLSKKKKCFLALSTEKFWEKCPSTNNELTYTASPRSRAQHDKL